MVALVAAVALAPWAQPLRFRPLQGWQHGAGGTFDSSYGPGGNIASPKESTAWMAKGVRYRDRPKADPPDATLSRLPRRGIVVFAAVYQSAQTTEGRIVLRLDHARRYPCCDGTYVAGGEYALTGRDLRPPTPSSFASTSARPRRSRCARRHSARSTASNCPGPVRQPKGSAPPARRRIPTARRRPP